MLNTGHTIYSWIYALLQLALSWMLDIGFRFISHWMIKKNKNSLFGGGSSKKPGLIELCDGWELVPTYFAATYSATDPNQLQTIEIQIANEGGIV